MNHPASGRIAAIIIACILFVPGIAQSQEALSADLPRAPELPAPTSLDPSKVLFEDWMAQAAADTAWAPHIQALSLEMSNAASASHNGFAFVLPAGDVTGDGRVDLVRGTLSTSPFRMAFDLVDANGVTLWHSDAFVLPEGDLDGDGLADFLTVESTRDDPCRYASCDPSIPLTLTVTPLAGNTGIPIWTRTFTSPPDTPYNRIFARISGDHDQDGATDVVVSSVSGASGINVLVVEVLSGRNGSRIADARIGPFVGYPDVQPAGDVDGNGGADLFILNLDSPVAVPGTGQVAGHLAAVDGLRFTPFWTTPWSAYRTACQGACTPVWTVDTPGTARDIMVVTNDDESGITYMHMDGTTGAIRWTRTFPASTRSLDVDDANHDGVIDTFAITSGGPNERAFTAINGRDGRDLHHETFPASGPSPGCGATLSFTRGDMDSDGVDDYSVTTGPCSPGSVIQVAIHSGRTGAPIVAAATATLGPRGAGNTDAVPGDDLLAVDAQGFSILNGRTLAPTWTRSFTPGSSAFNPVIPLRGDVDGDGFDDVVERVAFTNGTPGWFTVWSGRTGNAVVSFP